MLRKTHFDNVPIKPQRVYEEMNQVFGRDTCYVTTIGLSQIAGAQFLHVYKPRHWINCGQAGPLGWTIPAALGVRAADPHREVVALSGDYDFQFMIEELAVGAQFKLPYMHVVVNNSYLGLIRQAQRGFDMDFCVQLAFENINAPELDGYGVDHVAVAEGLGCKAIRVFEPEEIEPAFAQARGLDRRASGAGGRRDHPRARDQHRDGHRDRRVNEFEDLAATCRRPPCSLELLTALGEAAGDAFGRLAHATVAMATRATTIRRTRDDHAEIRSQPDHAVQRSAVPRPLRGRRARPASAASSSCFPYAFEPDRARRAARRQRPDAGAAQPAGRRLGGGRARHRLPAGSRRRVPRRRRPGDRLRDARWAARSSTAWSASRPPASTPTSVRATFVDNLRFAADEAEGGGHQAADRADQHLRHSGLLPEPHGAGARRSSTRSARTICSCSTTSITCSAWKANSADTHQGEPAADRARAARRQSRAATSRAPARSTIRFLFEHLDRIGYDGWIGCEYKPTATHATAWAGSRTAVS